MKPSTPAFFYLLALATANNLNTPSPSPTPTSTCTSYGDSLIPVPPNPRLAGHDYYVLESVQAKHELGSFTDFKIKNLTFETFTTSKCAPKCYSTKKCASIFVSFGRVLDNDGEAHPDRYACQYFDRPLVSEDFDRAVQPMRYAPSKGYNRVCKSERCPQLCIDNINACGQWYGGCAPHCEGDPWPSYKAPPCSSPPPVTPAKTPLTTTTTPTPTSSACPRVCIDNVDACGQWYGGCVPYCTGQPWPTFQKPSCSITSTTSSAPTGYGTGY